MIAPALITAVVLGALALSARSKPAGATKPPDRRVEPTPVPFPNAARPFRGLPYASVVRTRPEVRVYGVPERVKIVGLFNKETEPYFSMYAGVDVACLLPEDVCPRWTVNEHDILEKLS